MTAPFQSTLPVWGATHWFHWFAIASDISIHAPRVGSDDTIPQCTDITLISIHAPRVGSDGAVKVWGYAVSKFQSTLPVWGATCGSGWTYTAYQFQSTLPVWGATGREKAVFPWLRYFNPRSPCGERPSTLPAQTGKRRFQSTLPVWGATGAGIDYRKFVAISIHAPRVGSDLRRYESLL